MISLWEKRSLISYDIIIIGAGITGLSTAASLKEKNPKLNILVLERGLLPTGASTKNAGFACFGSLTELRNDLKVLGEEQNPLVRVEAHFGGRPGFGHGENERRGPPGWGSAPPNPILPFHERIKPLVKAGHALRLPLG